jgi:hypothetical protein
MRYAKKLRNVLNDYFAPGTYCIGSLAQVTKFSEGRWAMWDTQGDENRLFAYIPFQDMYIRQDSHVRTVARGSMCVICPKPVDLLSSGDLTCSLAFSVRLCVPRFI